MLPILGVIVVVAIIVMIDLPFLIRKKYKKEIWIFTVLLLISTTLSILWIIRVPMPSPLLVIEVIYKPINDMVNFLLT